MDMYHRKKNAKLTLGSPDCSVRQPNCVAKNSLASFHAFSTCNQRPEHRFEFWRSLFPQIGMDPVAKGSIRDFRGRVLSCTDETHSAFVFCTNDDTNAHFGRSKGNFLMLSLTLAGSAEVQYGTDTRICVRPKTGLIVLDGAKAISTRSRDHSVISLLLPREIALQFLGREPRAFRHGLSRIYHKGMASLLSSHLQQMAIQGEGLDPQSASAAMDAAVGMALVVLSQPKNREELFGGGGCHAAIFTAAKRYIHMNCANHELTAAVIARELGCSRAHLYRVFSLYEASVGDALREARLKKAATLLRDSTNMPIKLVAFSCGYADATAFARAFRTHRGMSPTEYRYTFRA